MAKGFQIGWSAEDFGSSEGWLRFGGMGGIGEMAEDDEAELSVGGEVTGERESGGIGSDDEDVVAGEAVGDGFAEEPVAEAARAEHGDEGVDGGEGDDQAGGAFDAGDEEATAEEEGRDEDGFGDGEKFLKARDGLVDGIEALGVAEERDEDGVEHGDAEVVCQGDAGGDPVGGRGEAPEDGEEGAADDATEVGDDEEPLAAGEGVGCGGRGSFG